MTKVHAISEHESFLELSFAMSNKIFSLTRKVSSAAVCWASNKFISIKFAKRKVFDPSTLDVENSLWLNGKQEPHRVVKLKESN